MVDIRAGIGMIGGILKHKIVKKYSNYLNLFI